MSPRSTTSADVRRVFDAMARHYDRQMRMVEWLLFRGNRQWAVSRARGEVVEIAVGTGLNLPLYPPDVTMIGIDLSDEMLRLARRRAQDERLGDRVDLRQGDVQALQLPTASADTVVSTFTLCTIPDPDAAVREVRRVLRPGGRFVLAEHGRSTSRIGTALMRLAEPLSVRCGADHLTRDPTAYLTRNGFGLDEVHRNRRGAFRILATRPDG